ncbi:hypothetical protein FO519_004586 [Halicephalobus sp. NKZ332]|nr:hypothetical protein FO519_004586 [Halicephalobus sp. NKZ332]
MGIPMVQVFMIMARQMSKPVADRIISYGKQHPVFRNKILIPVGKNIVHLTTRLRMKNLGLGAPTSVAPVSEAAALEQASDMIQQLVIFCYSVGVFAAYYYYQKANEKESVTFSHLGQIKDDMDAQFFELNRRLDMLEKQLKYTIESRSLLGGLLTRSKSESDVKPEPLPSRLSSSIPFDEAVRQLTSSGRQSF